MKKTKLGQELIKGLKEVIQYQRGEITLRSRTVEVPAEPPAWSDRDIARLRVEKLHVSQPIFAAYLGVSAAALRAWEQGLKRPSGSARRLLQLLDGASSEIIPMLFATHKAVRKRAP